MARAVFISSMFTICLMVHILINKQMRKAFDEIETSMAIHLEVQEEISKQVRSITLALSLSPFRHFLCPLVSPSLPFLMHTVTSFPQSLIMQP